MGLMLTKIKKSKSAYLFILPSMLVISLFMLVPMFLSICYIFTTFNIIQPPMFIGLDNIKELIYDDIFWISLKNVVFYTANLVFFETIISLVLAVGITSITRFKMFLRASYFIPVITSAVIASIIWRIIYNPEYGLANYFLVGLGFEPKDWLGNPRLALFSIVIMSLWKSVGYYMILFMAGLQSIPTRLYEAAKIDGAGRLQQFWSITLPLLRNTTLFVVVLATIWALQLFPEVLIMTGGGPGYSTMSPVYYIYRTAFRQLRMGYGATIACALFIIIFAVAMIQFKIIKPKEIY